MGSFDPNKRKLEYSALMDMITRTKRKKFNTVIPNNKLSVFQVIGLKILGAYIFSFWKMYFERHFAFQMHKKYFFSRNPEKIPSFPTKFR